jgi:hypothetical protein
VHGAVEDRFSSEHKRHAPQARHWALGVQARLLKVLRDALAHGSVKPTVGCKRRELVVRDLANLHETHNTRRDDAVNCHAGTRPLHGTARRLYAHSRTQAAAARGSEARAPVPVNTTPVT